MSQKIIGKYKTYVTSEISNEGVAEALEKYFQIDVDKTFKTTEKFEKFVKNVAEDMKANIANAYEDSMEDDVSDAIEDELKSVPSVVKIK